MGLRAPHSPVLTTGWLTGWRLTFGGEELGIDGAIATVVEDVAAQVFCVVYDVTEADEHTLDVWEGVELGRWRKIRARVAAEDSDLTAWMYVLDSWEGGLPSELYLAAVADAVEAGGAPTDYVAELRARPCDPLPLRGIDDV